MSTRTTKLELFISMADTLFMRKNQKGFAHILIIFVIVIAAIGALGYYAYKNGQLKTIPEQKTVDTPTTIPTQIISEALTSTPSKLDQTANWKTHSDNTYGFRVKYPTNWTIDTDGQYYVRLKSPNQTPDGQEPDSGAVFEIEMNKQTNPITLTELQGFTQSTDTLEISSKTEMALQGNPAISYQANDPTEANIDGLNVGLNNGFLRILMKNYGKLTTDRQIMQQILSTLKFLE